MSDLYEVGERDLIELGQSYADHVSHMPSERLHGKSDIAAELAFRDNRIAELERRIKVAQDMINYIVTDSESCETEWSSFESDLLVEEHAINELQEWLNNADK